MKGLLMQFSLPGCSTGLLLALVLAWSGNSAMAQGRTPTDAAIRFEKLSAIEMAAEDCQPPSREAKAGFQRNLDAARAAYAQSLARAGAGSPETELARRRNAQRARIKTIIDASGCGNGDLVQLMLQYQHISDWNPQQGPYPLPPGPPEFPLSVKYTLLSAAGYKQSGGVWRNECGRPVDPEFSTAKLTDSGAEFAIVTTVDAACYGQAEVRNTVLRHRAGGTWQSLSEMAGVLTVGSYRTRGYRELVLGGSGCCGNEIYRWNGQTYAYACNQADDADDAMRAMCKSRSDGRRWCKAPH